VPQRLEQRFSRLVRCLAISIFTAAAGAHAARAQSLAPGPPGPYVLDVRGIAIGMPSAPTFYPTLPAATLVPARGFGADVGGQIYVLRLGPARIGVGANVIWARGTASTPPQASSSTSSSASGSTAPVTPSDTDDDVLPPVLPPDTRATLLIVAPQISVNFGTADGWSYLSGGAGAAQFETATRGATQTASRSTGAVTAFNAGGGARWFMTRRVAVGFDLRLHWISGTPRSTVGSASEGLSLR
jgi:hypothetical protein